MLERTFFFISARLMSEICSVCGQVIAELQRREQGTVTKYRKAEQNRQACPLGCRVLDRINSNQCLGHRICSCLCCFPQELGYNVK